MFAYIWFDCFVLLLIFKAVELQTVLLDYIHYGHQYIHSCHIIYFSSPNGQTCISIAIGQKIYCQTVPSQTKVNIESSYISFKNRGFD